VKFPKNKLFIITFLKCYDLKIHSTEGFARSYFTYCHVVIPCGELRFFLYSKQVGVGQKHFGPNLSSDQRLKNSSYQDSIERVDRGGARDKVRSRDSLQILWGPHL
jgi:hypothetical protein